MIEKLFYQSGKLNLTARPELENILDELYKLTDFYPGYIPKQKNKKDKNGNIICRVKIYKEKLSKEDLTCQNEECDNMVNYEFQKQVFTKYCCKSCKSNSKVVKKKIADTLESKYGARTLGGNSEFRKKAEKTMLEKYGVLNASHSEVLKNKAKTTLGVDNASQLNITNYEHWNDADYIENNFLDNKKQILVEKMCKYFNCTSSIARDRFIKLDIDFISNMYKNIENYELWNDVEYIKNNCLNSNGTINYNYFNTFFNVGDSRAIKKLKDLNIPYIKSIYKNIQNYENYFDREFIINEFIENEFINYDKMCKYFKIDNGTALRKIKSLDIQYTNNIYKNITNYEHWNDADYIENNFLDDKRQILVEKMCKYFNCQQPAVHKRFKDLNIEFNKRKGNSEAETEIINFLNDPTTTQGDKKLIGKELDILLPNKFAVEYNGLMFHSQGISKYSMFHNPAENKSKHLEKTELVEATGIQLFQIFENEWNTKKEIWKSVLNSKNGTTTRIFGRKTVIKEVDAKTARIFEDRNHLQGQGNSKFRYGLYYNDELVSLMTFGKARMSKKYEYELIRFCSKLNTTVLGAASKLLKHFEKTVKPKSLVTYANRRWSTGHLYDTIGFTLSHISAPNYFYFKPDNQNLLESRNKYQKHKLHRLLENFNPELTETINMYNHGYRKIYDAGNKVYYKNYE